jgi:hypothetical protein
MSGFTHHTGPQQAAASQASAPPSALDLVQAQGVNTWETLLSPVAETSQTALSDDSELLNSQDFLLGVPTFSSEFEAASASADPLSWDLPAFSASPLRPTAIAVSDVHTLEQRLSNPTTQPAISSAYASTFAMMPMEAQNYTTYPFGTCL